jgi:hypothetical protein
MVLGLYVGVGFVLGLDLPGASNRLIPANPHVLTI